MALAHLDFHSDVLGMAVSADVILPQPAKTLIGMDTGSETETVKTLYLLHGLSDDHTIWQRRTSIERYAAARGIAVVMPNVHRSWYTDMLHGQRYFTYVTEELPRFCRSFFRGLSDKKEDNYIAGLSMGGYGALKIAYTYPERYAAAAALSGAFDVSRRAFRDRDRGVTEFFDIFGDPEKVAGSKHDVYALLRSLIAEKKEIPPTYLWCGTEDSILEESRRLHDIIRESDADYVYRESAGGHAWECWDREIQNVLSFFFDGKRDF